MCAAYVPDPLLLENAASGGVMTAIAAYLMTSGRVQGAIVTKFSYGVDGPKPQTFIAQHPDELIDAQGSKYCPVPALTAINDVEKHSGSFVFVGTPCQVAGLRLLQLHRKDLKSRFPYTIGNFCGGFRDLREMHRLIERQGIRVGNVTRFRYRGGGQPGSMLIEDHEGHIVTKPYPDYAKEVGIAKHIRCRLCVDATAELADFSCGDAWLPRFLQSGRPWSLLMVRNVEATHVLEEMVKQHRLVICDVSPEEVKQSQFQNLASKKKRQHARRKLMSLLGHQLPAWDGGYPETKGGLVHELKVHLTHLVFEKAEVMGLYPALNRLIRRLRHI